MKHGLASTYRKDGCRCPACREAATRAQWAWRTGRPPEEWAPRRPAAHGTRACYQKRRCRCEPCTAANREYVRFRALGIPLADPLVEAALR